METQLANLGIEFRSLKSFLNQEDRNQAISDFNDPESEVMVLLFTNQLGSSSLNLQMSSHCVIIMEIPINFGTLIQTMGRVNRIGQEFEQWIIIPWIDYSFDQMCWHRIFKKIVPSLVGEGSAAQHDDPEAFAQGLIQRYLGLKPSHTPLDPSWGEATYAAKDVLIAKIEAGGQDGEDPATDAEQAPEEPPTQQEPEEPPSQRRRKLKKLARVPAPRIYVPGKSSSMLPILPIYAFADFYSR